MQTTSDSYEQLLQLIVNNHSQLQGNCLACETPLRTMLELANSHTIYSIIVQLCCHDLYVADIG